jgi:hypothetical protein
LNKDKRYDWKNFLSDSFVTIKYNEDIRISSNDLNSKLSLTLDDQTYINDIKVENLAESLKDKAEAIISYYQDLNEFKNLKEVSFFLMYTLIEVKLFQEFIRPKDAFYEDEELHVVKLSKSNYDYCYCNFLKNSIYINKENPMLENYSKTFKSLETVLLEIIRKVISKLGVNIEDINTLEYLADSMKGNYYANLEKYFFEIFEKALLHFSNNEYKEAANDFIISKYFYEMVIFIRLILNDKPETISFAKVFEFIENDDEINLFSEFKKKNKNWQVNFDNLLLFTFVGGIIKSFKTNKIIDSEIISDTILVQTNKAIDSLIKFYADIIKMILECSKLT